MNVEETAPPVYIEEGSGSMVRLNLTLEELNELRERGATFRESTATRDGGLVLE